MSFVLIIEDHNNATVDVSIWNKIDSAFEEACSIIADELRHRYTASTLSVQDIEINNLINQGAYVAAVDSWNDAHEDLSFIVHLRTENHTVSSINAYTAAELASNKHITGTSTIPDDVVLASEEPAWSKISGATCRSCNNYNDYAYPDCENKTYICYSCKNH